MSRTTRSHAGWLARKRGQVNENWIEIQAATLDCLLIKQHPEMKVLGDPSKAGNVRLSGKGYPDYLLISNNFLVMFDAKTTLNKGTWSPSIKKKHQFDAMRQVAKICDDRIAVAGYLVYWQPHEMGEFFPVTRTTEWPFRCQWGEGDFTAKGDDWFQEIYRHWQRWFDGNLNQKRA